MRLIHCSDIHLDIPFGNILSQDKSATRKQELLSAFVQMVGFAASEDALGVLITGGLVDSEHISRQTMANWVIQCSERYLAFMAAA